jgi:hypothetical protein
MTLEGILGYAQKTLNEEQYEKYKNKVLGDMYPSRKKETNPEKHWLKLPKANTINSSKTTFVSGII